MPARFIVLDRTGAPPPEPEPPPAFTPASMLMGCSYSDYGHGGTEDWDGWRVYKKSPRNTLASRTGSTRPLFLMYSEDGGDVFSGSYTSIYNYVINELNLFYYGSTSTTNQTRSSKWGIILYWLNGNENYDKLGSPTTANIASYTASMKALYDACHFIEPTTGARRFPDAWSGSNPTQYQEYKGLVQAFLHPTAKYHDFLPWSMYNPGRGSTDTDPTYDWATFVDADRTVLNKGFLTRCFYRTSQARAYARAETGNADFDIQIGCGEVGIASDPGDPVTRPYYAALGLAGNMYKLAVQHDLVMPAACWWDSTKPGGGPHNILSDEGPASDHGSAGTPNPSTRVAWQNWASYDPRVGGTKAAQWSGTPKSGWKDTGIPL